MKIYALNTSTVIKTARNNFKSHLSFSFLSIAETNFVSIRQKKNYKNYKLTLSEKGQYNTIETMDKNMEKAQFIYQF